MKQRSFFDDEIDADMRAKKGIPPVDPHVGIEDEPRLSGQNQAILDRLKQGPATNMELIRIASRFGARIKDIRTAGFTIEVCSLGGGLYEYQLIEGVKNVGSVTEEKPKDSHR